MFEFIPEEWVSCWHDMLGQCGMGAMWEWQSYPTLPGLCGMNAAASQLCDEAEATIPVYLIAWQQQAHQALNACSVQM